MIIVKENWFYRSLSPLGPAPPRAHCAGIVNLSREGRSP
jgi:hypothetical protein